MEEMLALPEDLREEAHLMELESMGYTIVHEAIPPDLLRRLKICHEQACQRIRDCKPEADWSWESDNEGVVDYWRLYALDPVYEELLTLPSIYNICQRAIIEGRGGAEMEPHPAGPILVHEMAQHAPGRTPGGQQWCVCQYRARHARDESASDTLCCDVSASDSLCCGTKAPRWRSNQPKPAMHLHSQRPRSRWRRHDRARRLAHAGIIRIRQGAELPGALRLRAAQRWSLRSAVRSISQSPPCNAQRGHAARPSRQLYD